MRLNLMDVVDLIDPNGSEGIWLNIYKMGSTEIEAKINTASRFLDSFSNLEIIRIAAASVDEFNLYIGEKDD